nr:MAG TPA: hypothetical protein [Caudoviricetes sp.]
MKNKDKYDLRDISYALELNNGRYDFVVYCDLIEIHREGFCGINSVCCTFAKWLEEEYVPNILTDKEKAYLSAVIKPFRKRIKYIEKIDHSNVNDDQYLCIALENDRCVLPNFKKGTMYKGMRTGKRYTLEELGL